MGQLNEVCAEDFDKMCRFLEQVYGGAFCAIQYGATRESLLDQIDQALECVEEMKKDGFFVGPDAASQIPPRE